MPLLPDMLMQVLDYQKRMASQRYCLVQIPDSGYPRVSEYDSLDGLRTAIRQCLETPCFLQAFMGHHLPITAGPHRFLRTPLGSIPLFDMPEPTAAAEAEHGWVGNYDLSENTGSPPAAAAAPAEEPVMAAASPAMAAVFQSEGPPDADADTPVL